ncbi:hypothetical protein WH297_23445 [Ochrobactrum vermis]|uniref:Uncharacterized protein n=1 Tax=Ochrobactrum vermis TaxID=1827297 RepID=A0ABU8PK81_9HYPH
MRLPPVVIAAFYRMRFNIPAGFSRKFSSNGMQSNRFIRSALKALIYPAKSGTEPGIRGFNTQEETSATGLNGYMADRVPAHLDFTPANANIDAGTWVAVSAP